MRQISKAVRWAGVLALVALFLVPAASFAGGELFDDTVSSCSTANCSSLRLPGTVLSFTPTAAVFTVDVFAAPGECVRLDVASMGASPIDLEMVVVAPNGSVFRNDDRNGASDRKPLVKIGSAPNNGWYTVHIAQFNGSAVTTNFVLLYGRYPGGNANCSGPTVPVFTANGTKQQETVPDAAPFAAPNAPGASE